MSTSAAGVSVSRGADAVHEAAGSEQPDSTSLASYGESVHARSTNASERCPRSRGRWIHRYTGEWFWDVCTRNRCIVCGPRKAHSIAGAIGISEPQRWGRFSLIGDDWQTARARIKRVRYDIRRAGFEWNDCYHVERNPRGTGYHAHWFQHGEYVSQHVLQELCQKRGMGYPFVQKWEPTSIRAHGYVLKQATGYGLKGAHRSDTLREYLANNGGRLVHASRGFWRDGESGGRLAGMDAARRVYAERKYGPREPWSPVDWKLERG